jgi:methylated-DNA-[protein]-cysteine S-methyltransferase
MDSEKAGKVKAMISTPLGFIEIIVVGGFVKGIYFREDEAKESIPESLSDVAGQLKRYFSGELKTFDLPVKPEGTDFQMTVWNLLKDIPYGTTTTYGEIAKQLGLRNGARAVGLANGSNPVSIAIPCHRVIGQNGKLTGYAGGLWRKEWLLKMEHSNQGVGLFRK